MKTSILPIFLLHILAYVVYCAAAPSYPTPTGVQTFKPRVWNFVGGVGPPGFNGFCQLDDYGVFYNLTVNYQGFPAYFDPANPGVIREASSGHYAALVPTSTQGLYDFEFLPHTGAPGVLWQKFTLKQLGCGFCSGFYIQYDPTSTNPDVDNTNATFLITPHPQRAGSWKVQWNELSKNPTIPVGSHDVYLSEN